MFPQSNRISLHPAAGIPEVVPPVLAKARSASVAAAMLTLASIRATDVGSAETITVLFVFEKDEIEMSGL
jgi:hypothetical protein